MNLWRKDEGVRRFVLARRFAKLAEDLLGVKGVRVYHDQALLKEPCGGITPWHQDQHYWPLDTRNTLTMWMPLVDVTAEMGTMHFASGSHREGYLGDMPISDASEQSFQEYIRTRGCEVVSGQVMAAGDASFHYGWTLHGAPGNTTTRMREVMTVIWFEEGARVTAPDNPNRARDLERRLPGLKPGDVAASALNPLVWNAERASINL
jgi:ectoine hydroxylase-related dioxygenase (phytanoyl-CoA dioxygenase family)